MTAPSGVSVVEPQAEAILLNLDRVEIDLKASGKAKEKTVSISKHGLYDLLKIRNDVLGALGIKLPAGETAVRIRLITAEGGHQVFHHSQQICLDGVKVPSGEQSGVKIQMAALDVKAGESYRLQIPKATFDSIVVQTGHGSCNIHPSYQAVLDSVSSDR